ncbi:MAG: hypothetical protein A4S09_12875 [Proteobacteria bacterium SG_bin7]|nr:MAG: hypothetical protein A4S09_12875 [Proteobacteria bacterium SG_bin7]
MIKRMLVLVGVILVAKTVVAADPKVELDESDLSKKTFGEDQPLKVQDTLPVPQREVNLRLIQSQVLNLNLSEKELEESDAPVEE